MGGCGRGLHAVFIESAELVPPPPPAARRPPPVLPPLPPSAVREREAVHQTDTSCRWSLLRWVHRRIRVHGVSPGTPNQHTSLGVLHELVC